MNHIAIIALHKVLFFTVNFSIDKDLLMGRFKALLLDRNIYNQIINIVIHTSNILNCTYNESINLVLDDYYIADDNKTLKLFLISHAMVDDPENSPQYVEEFNSLIDRLDEKRIKLFELPITICLSPIINISYPTYVYMKILVIAFNYILTNARDLHSYGVYSKIHIQQLNKQLGILLFGMGSEIQNINRTEWYDGEFIRLLIRIINSLKEEKHNCPISDYHSSIIFSSICKNLKKYNKLYPHYNVKEDLELIDILIFHSEYKRINTENKFQKKTYQPSETMHTIMEI